MSELRIDWTRCDAHGLCAALLPGSVSLDEWGFPLIPATGISEADARRAVTACPSLALRWADTARPS